jgi:hypothetical protein
METKLTVDTIKSDAFVDAVKRLREIFSDKPEHFITLCKERLFDVEFIGNRKGFDVYKVYKNEKLGDNYSQRYRTVFIKASSQGIIFHKFCTCFYGFYGKSRHFDVCTHVGAVLLHRLYHSMLDRTPFDK